MLIDNRINLILAQYNYPHNQFMQKKDTLKSAQPLKQLYSDSDSQPVEEQQQSSVTLNANLTDSETVNSRSLQIKYADARLSLDSEILHQDFNFGHEDLMINRKFSQVLDRDSMLQKENKDNNSNIGNTLTTQQKQKLLQYNFTRETSPSQSTLCEPSEERQQIQQMVLSIEMLDFQIRKPRSHSQNQIVHNLQPKQQQIHDQQQFVNQRKYSLNQPGEDYELELQKVDSENYVKIDKITIKINKNMAIYLQEYFAKLKIPIPTPCQQLFEEKNSLPFWKLYFKYLHSTNQQILKDALIEISNKKYKSPSVRKNQSQSTWQLLPGLFNKPAYSKARLLKSHLLLQLSCLQKMRKRLTSKFLTKNLAEISNLYEQLARLQMLLGFENTIAIYKTAAEKQKSKQDQIQYLLMKEMEASAQRAMKNWCKQYDTHVHI